MDYGTYLNATNNISSTTEYKVAFTNKSMSIATRMLKITIRRRKRVMDTLLPAGTIATVAISSEGNHTVASNNGTVS